MGPLLTAFATAGAAIVAAMTLLWLVSLARRDVSIVDVFWGPGFVLVAWIYRLSGAPPVARQTLMLALVTVWGLRLAAYILWRNRGKGEDFRYRAMRERQGPRFAYLSLVTVFLLQGALILVISLPFLVIQVPALDAAWAWTDLLALALWAVGFFFETVGDWQMARFKADPANQGKVLRSGLWAWTRHPNYFGDAMVWWGFFFFALAAPNGWWTLPCPILMTVFLLKVSGVALLEKTIAGRRPEYRDYVQSTSAFIPWFPRRKGAGD